MFSGVGAIGRYKESSHFEELAMHSLLVQPGATYRVSAPLNLLFGLSLEEEKANMMETKEQRKASLLI